MGIFLVFISAGFCAASNFCMRRSIDRGGTTQAFLVMQMSIACLVGFLLGPLKAQQFSLSPSMLVLGISAGLVYSFMLGSLGKALEKGPAGLTFSILSGATVFPAIVMASYFGLSFGYTYTFWHAIGSIVVLAGLFWAGRGLQGMTHFRSWLFFAFAMFALHICLLVIFQWRALLLNTPRPEEIASFFSAEQIRSAWFMTLMYGTAMFMQIFFFLKNEKRPLGRSEVVNGMMGGVMNSLGTFFLIWATEVANSLENAVIYPIFSVLVILLSNLWSQKVYRESVNWRACQICALGLLIATVDWKGVLAAVGWMR
jgi:hypothetical protein